MTRIDGFNPNLPPVGPRKIAAKQENVNAQPQAETANTNFKSSEEILNYLTNTGYSPVEAQKQSKTTSKTVIPVSLYVTPEQAQRIAGSVQQFQGLHNSISDLAQSELSIPKELADKVALETLETQYMPV